MLITSLNSRFSPRNSTSIIIIIKTIHPGTCAALLPAAWLDEIIPVTSPCAVWSELTTDQSRIPSQVPSFCNRMIFSLLHFHSHPYSRPFLPWSVFNEFHWYLKMIIILSGELFHRSSAICLYTREWCKRFNDILSYVKRCIWLHFHDICNQFGINCFVILLCASLEILLLARITSDHK